ncbi:S-layer homology domain-containing protein [Paenibacillus protaetiae]|uniref:S-layer homology domain-containing protein n=1 Tax=Paenibacillus protaetiae TaxID=2509456 RepID=A0A4P6ERS2_9BACL|nr:S-layer homology domain-containing protein [Paenibacillus protaetiae]QAY65135.1 S-layer homology domain-containing protein [Paenibacillus protaetiae]
MSKKGTKRFSSIFVSVLMAISMAPSAFATNYYNPSDQGPSLAGPPAGREYFPADPSELPSSEGLPDLFKFLDPSEGTDGYVTTKEQWDDRRSELSDLLQYYYYGYKHETDKSDVTYSGSFGTTNATLTVTVSNPDNDKSASYDVTGIYIPTYKEGVADEDLQPGETNIAPPYPFVIGVGGGVSANMRNAFLRRGYAVMNNPTNTIYSDNASRSGVYTTLYPFDKDTYEGDSGALMGWAWGISRTIDALENGAYEGLIDPTRSVVTGVSRNGKGAALAGAFDDRISIVVPVDPGQGGIASMRYTSEGRIYNYNVPDATTGSPNAASSNSNMNRSFFRNEKPTNLLSSSEAHWLDIKAEGFRNDVDKLPFDSHALAALIAPRPLLTFTGEGFDWLSSPSNVLATAAAKEVYEFLGAGDNIGIVVHDGAHAFQDRDHAYMLAIMDREFRGDHQSEQLQTEGPDTLGVTVNPPIRPAQTFSSVWDMSAYPFEVDSSYIQWSRPGKYTLYTTNELLTAGYAATVKAYSNAPRVQLDTGSGVYTADVKNGIATFNLKANQVTQGRYTLSTIGGDEDTQTVYLQCYDLTSILRTSITGDDTGDQRWVFGFTSKVDPDAIKMFANNTPIPASKNEGEEPGWILSYGASINTGYSSADADGSNVKHFFQDEVSDFPASYTANTNRVVRLEDVVLESLPNFNFQFSYDINMAKSVLKPSWPSTNIKIGPSPDWPVYPNKNTDTGERPEQLPWPATSLGAVAFNPDNAKITTQTNNVTIGFENPMDTQNIGFGTNFADDYTLSWNEDNTKLTIGFNHAVSAGSQLIIARLKDAAGNVNVQPYVFDLSPQSTGGDTGSHNPPSVTNPAQPEVPVQPEHPFVDIEGHWAAPYIESLAAQQYISGTGDGRFNPNGILTRAEIVQMLFNAFGKKAAADHALPFEDTVPGVWYTDAVAWAADQGIVTGYTTSRFGPSDPITRQDFTVILSRLAAMYHLDLKPAAQGQPFADDSLISGYAKDAVYQLQAAGIIGGKENHQFDPKGRATRAEAAKMLYLTLDKAGLIDPKYAVES